MNLGAMKSEPKVQNVPNVKIEGGQGTAKSISQPTSRPIMEGSDRKEKADGGKASPSEVKILSFCCKIGVLYAMMVGTLCIAVTGVPRFITYFVMFLL